MFVERNTIISIPITFSIARSSISVEHLYAVALFIKKALNGLN